MKRLFSISIALILLITQLAAQESTFRKGDNVLNLGLGLGATYYNNVYISSSPAFTASYEVCIVDGLIDNKGSIGVGGYFAFSSARSEVYRTSNFIFGGRGNFHYPLVDKLDTYTGLMLGYNVYNNNHISNNTDLGPSSALASAWYIGGRYYFNKQFSAMAELGYGTAVLTVGVAIKF